MIVYTKADKSKEHEVNENIIAFEAKLLETWHELPQIFKTSALKREGRDELLAYIEDINEKFAEWNKK